MTNVLTLAALDGELRTACDFLIEVVGQPRMLRSVLSQHFSCFYKVHTTLLHQSVAHDVSGSFVNLGDHLIHRRRDCAELLRHKTIRVLCYIFLIKPGDLEWIVSVGFGARLLHEKPMCFSECSEEVFICPIIRPTHQQISRKMVVYLKRIVPIDRVSMTVCCTK
jgi:hypothetical protein